jgi:eukaryotic-like serine/threonine-protein kinase
VTISLRVGSVLGENLLILDLVSAGPEPVCLVWHRTRWCMMACKVMTTPARARAEASTMNALMHPAIVRCLGVEAPRYLLMEYLEGPTVRNLLRGLKKQHFSRSDAVRVAITIGGALAYLHSTGRVHLDVKPGNIIIHNGRPVFIDVGTVRHASRQALGRLVGSDDYMSPEQCRREAVSAASDVFGLSASLYHMLSGKAPFFGATKARPFPQLLRPPVPLRRRLPSAPAGLEALVHAGLSSNPQQRPALAQLLPALHEFIATGPPIWPPNSVDTHVDSV